VTDPEPEDLERLHVLTPWLQSWRYLLIGLGAAVAVFRDNLSFVGDAYNALRDQPLLVVLVVGLAGFLAVGGVVMGWSYLSWRMTGYAVQGGTLFLRRGVIVRQRRQVRLDRLQGIDVQQPVLARAFGLATLKLELAAGKEANTSLGYLTLSDAHELRGELLERSGRRGAERPSADMPGAEPTERPLLTVPTGRVAQAVLLESCLLLGALGGYVVVSTFVVLLAGGGIGAVLAALLPVVPGLLAIGGAAVSRFLREADFRLAESADGLRIHSGLLSLNHRTIPPRRIQGVHVAVPMTWRLTGWARLTVDVAGSEAGGGGEGFQPAVNTLVPVASDAEVLPLFARVSGLTLSDLALSPAPRRTRWLNPLAFGWLGVGLTDTVAVTRTGWFQRRTAVVPFARIQSVRVVQGPLQRWLRLATVHLDGAVGSAGWAAPHRDLDDAHALVHSLAARARTARLAEH
jgi:putative membrane protein